MFVTFDKKVRIKVINVGSYTATIVASFCEWAYSSVVVEGITFVKIDLVNASGIEY